MAKRTEGGAAVSATPCPKCGDTGYFLTDRGVAVCDCRREQDLTDRLHREGRIPKKFLKKTLSSYLAQTARHKAILTEARSYVETFAESAEDGSGCRGLLLRGGVGTGKTHLAVGIARELAARGRSVLFWNVPELFLELRRVVGGDSESASEGELLNQMRHADLLILDDLGTEKSSEFTIDRLYFVINSRYGADAALIVTTNCNWAEMEERVGRPTTSRLAEMCSELSFPEGDFRRRNLT